jgi:hypothetical protein
MKNLIEESFSKFKRGEWIGVVRAKVIEWDKDFAFFFNFEVWLNGADF